MGFLAIPSAHDGAGTREQLRDPSPVEISALGPLATPRLVATFFGSYVQMIPSREQTMEPMKPMAPIEPMDTGPAWWPDHLGNPTTSGGQDQMRYAFFPEHRRLAVVEDGKLTLYDTGNHDISSASQQHGEPLRFSGKHGNVDLSELSKVT